MKPVRQFSSDFVWGRPRPAAASQAAFQFTSGAESPAQAMGLPHKITQPGDIELKAESPWKLAPGYSKRSHMYKYLFFSFALLASAQRMFTAADYARAEKFMTYNTS